MIQGICGLGFGIAACVLCPLIFIGIGGLFCCNAVPGDLAEGDGPHELRADEMTWGSTANQRSTTTTNSVGSESKEGLINPLESSLLSEKEREKDREVVIDIRPSSPSSVAGSRERSSSGLFTTGPNLVGTL